ncbi:MAG: cytochrome c3 family protein [Bryobacteraceae bacterium]|nr:cytochrome c3 family protein [Bryobacteraceae bacterium]
MALLFPKSTDQYVRIGALLIGFLTLGGVATGLYITWPDNLKTGYTPVQPVAYSHKLHAGELGMDCYYCHYTVTKAAYAAVPQTEVCMNCHHQVKSNSPRLTKVRDSYQTGESIPWVKVHKLADYVYFNHQSHVTAGVSCVSCHGRIDQMVEVKQVEPLNMAWCLDCHRNPAPNIRPVDQVTNLAWVPDRDPAEIGREIIQARGINPPQNCSGCHR